MKNNFKLLGYTLVVCLAMIACESNELDQILVSDDLKKANHGLIESYDPAMVLSWNQALSLVIDNKMPPPAETRVYAMVSLAVHDALNKVVPIYETYALDNKGVYVKGISKKDIHLVANAAVAQAAHDVMVALAPGSAASAGSLLTESLSAAGESEFTDRGIQIGKEAARTVLTERQNDLPLKFHTYTQGTEPGEYQSPMPYDVANQVWPDNAAFAPDMGEFKPFGLESSNQFRAKAPYPLDSPEYAQDYNEVKALGSNTSTERTAEQADMGVFFLDNVSNSINRIARIMAGQEKLNGWETARLLALTHMTQFDACLSSFEGKYYYNRWRPVTAIKLGETDGNEATSGDAAWSILQAARATPPTPTYPSTHAEMAGAGAQLFQLFFKKDNKAFELESYSLTGMERSFESFSQFASECCISRIYIGYHFRNDVVQGEKMGREVAEYVYENNLKELK